MGKGLTLFQRALNRFGIKTYEDSPPNFISRLINREIRPTSGTSIFGGIYGEEYLTQLRGQSGSEVYDEMRRGDPQISMVLKAILNPLMRAHWKIEPYSVEDDAQAEEFQRHADFINFQLFDDLYCPWDQLLGEILTFVPFGFSIFWRIHKQVAAHPEFGPYTGLEGLYYLSQKTIQRWNLDPATGLLVSVEQNAGGGDLANYLTLPSEFLTVFTLQREGANYEGISMLRSCYGSWWRKNLYLKLEGIGIENAALGTPVAKSDGVVTQDDDEVQRIQEILERMAIHEKQSIVLGQGWSLENFKRDFNGEAIDKAIRKEDESIARAVAANFLNLGQGSSGGAYALGKDLSDFFLQGIEYLGSIVTSVINREIIPELIQINYGPQAGYPRLCCTDIADKAGKELADTLAVLRNAQTLSWSEEDEADLRERYGLREKSPDAKMLERSSPFQQANNPTPTDNEDAGAYSTAKYAEKKSEGATRGPAKMMAQGEEALGELMRTNMRFIASKLIADIMSNYDRLSDSEKPLATKGVEPGGVARYKQQLRSSYINLSVKALNAVISENPKISSEKFAQKYADDLAINQPFKKRDFKKLPKRVRDSITRAADFMVDTEVADLFKAVGFQFGNSISSTDSRSILVGDLEEAAEKVLDRSGVASAIAAAKIVNETRMGYFFDDEVIEQIGGFKFVNLAPVTEICNELNGRIFTKTDGESLRYEPPLHHNCKSFLEALEVGSKELAKAKKDDDLGLNPTKRAKEDITLSSLTKDQAALLGTPWIDFNADALQVQAIVFSKSLFKKQEAIDWVKIRYLYSDQTEDRKDEIHVRQSPPDWFDQSSLRSFSVQDGVTIVTGKIKG